MNSCRRSVPHLSLFFYLLLTPQLLSNIFNNDLWDKILLERILLLAGRGGELRMREREGEL